MADTFQGDGWWEASDGKWYPPESPSSSLRPRSPSDVGETAHSAYSSAWPVASPPSHTAPSGSPPAPIGQPTPGGGEVSAAETGRPKVWSAKRFVSLTGALLLGAFGFGGTMPPLFELLRGGREVQAETTGLIGIGVILVWAVVSVRLFRAGRDRFVWMLVGRAWIALVVFSVAVGLIW